MWLTGWQIQTWLSIAECLPVRNAHQQCRKKPKHPVEKPLSISWYHRFCGDKPRNIRHHGKSKMGVFLLALHPHFDSGWQHKIAARLG